MDLPFHPLIRAWFARRFREPTAAQAQGWPQILAGRDTLIAAPTGSGKTLAAFLVCLDRLLRRADTGALDDATEVVYISPLKALSNDIHRNLEQPLEELRQVARELGYPEPAIRVAVRTGDSSPAERQALVSRPPHILITTPESFYLLLTAERSRQVLRTVRTVIVDEVHAVFRDKRGSHLALSLARLDALVQGTQPHPDPLAWREEGWRPQRIGLSATQRPIEAIARFLVGTEAPLPAIVDVGHQRDLDLGIEVPPTELEAVCSAQQWADIYDRIAALAQEHRTTLVFVNTRRLAERVAYQLSERLGEGRVAAHHGSLAKERRFQLEQRLKAGEMQVMVATASLELGIDIGTVELVCQIGSPRSIATFLQRVGRSGHALGLTPKGRLFPTTRDELVECAALLRAVRAGRLDAIVPPVAPLDILAQQLVAEASCRSWNEDELFDLVRRAAPYASLRREDFDQVLEMLSEGFAGRYGRVSAYLHRDRINGTVRGRRGARMAALTSGGAIPEVADYRVVADPEGTFIGTVNEDFAVESLPGDVFLLGTTSWRIRKVEPNTVRVEDAQGAPPSVPFWLGEAPARTSELSVEVSELRQAVADRLGDPASAIGWLVAECCLDAFGAEQIVRYIRATKEALGLVPSQGDVVFERFFDESGGMQLVIHAPFGGRINRAWALSLRKRFCVTFDFELQAAATDDAIVLSLGLQHSFPLEDAFGFVRASNAREVLIQALLAAPMFTTRWRWNATRALAVLRQRGGRKVPPPLQRMQADDLLAAIFPQLAACQENIEFPYQLPDHPLVRQTVEDCLQEAMDLEGLVALLERIEAGEVRLHARDTVEPSPMSHEVLTARPYAYLDDAPLEERRARAVTLRRTLPEQGRDLGALDPQAIQRVREEAWPAPRDADELHDALLGLVAVPEQLMLDPRGPVRPELVEGWFAELRAAGRAAVAETREGRRLWFAAEELPTVEALYPEARIMPAVRLPDHLAQERPAPDVALVRLLRGQMDFVGPITVRELAERLGLSPEDVAIGLAQLEGQGIVLRGRFTPGAIGEEYCERRLLARIHRATLDRLRQEIEPVSAQDLLRTLLRWQHVAPNAQLVGRRGLLEAIGQLQGFEAPAVAWEGSLLQARVTGYQSSWLDELCLAGEVVWGRLTLRPGNGENGGRAQPSRATPVTLALRRDLPWLLAAARGDKRANEPAGGAAQEVLGVLRRRGALFLSDLIALTRRLPSEVEGALWELVAGGMVTSDGFQPLRSLLAGSVSSRANASAARSRRLQRLASPFTAPPGGRWTLFADEYEVEPSELAEQVARQWLLRYGIVFRDLVAREQSNVPWREVVRALRRMEDQGLVRGGRFVAGFSGEQYALPEAVEALRQTRRRGPSGEVVRVSAVDPLNLVGIVTPGPRVPAVHTNAVVYRDGVPVATLEGGELIVRAEGGEAAARTVGIKAPAKSRKWALVTAPR